MTIQHRTKRALEAARPALERGDRDAIDAELAAHGISYSTARKHLGRLPRKRPEKYRLNSKKAGRAFAVLADLIAREMRETGETDAEIAERHRVTREYVGQIKSEAEGAGMLAILRELKR